MPWPAHSPGEPAAPAAASVNRSSTVQQSKLFNYHWRTAPAVEQLERHIHELRTTVIRLRREIKNKQGHVGRLTILVQQRSNTIDDLRGKLEQSRQQIQQLNEEADHLAALVRMS